MNLLNSLFASLDSHTSPRVPLEFIWLEFLDGQGIPPDTKPTILVIMNKYGAVRSPEAHRELMGIGLTPANIDAIEAFAGCRTLKEMEPFLIPGTLERLGSRT